MLCRWPPGSAVTERRPRVSSSSSAPGAAEGKAAQASLSAPPSATLSRATAAPPPQRNRNNCRQCSRETGTTPASPTKTGAVAGTSPMPTHLKASALCTQTRSR